MKKVFLILLMLFIFALSACSNSKPKDISCEEIIKTYEDVGYVVEHHIHKEDMTDSDVKCRIKINDPKNPKDNYLYIDRYTNEEKATSYMKDMKYNVVVWFVSSLYGESRWLKSKQYGVIHYHTFNGKMTKPLEELMK